MSAKRTICVAGKNQIATRFLEWALQEFPDAGDYVVLCNQNDTGKHAWQPSLRFTAANLGCSEISLSTAESIDDILFLSLEYDRIVDPSKFKSKELYNVHFSELPKFRGMSTSVWPILLGETSSGVTLHRIDSGIDTGEIVSQKTFEIGNDWNSRDLYFSYLEHGLALAKSGFENLLQGDVESRPQPANGATYYGRRDLDYADLPMRFNQTAWQVSNAIRAFSFHEYQYPSHKSAGSILRAKVRNRYSKRPAGSFIKTSDWRGELATLDFDLDIVLSPYEAIYEWCKGSQAPDSLEEALNLIDVDQTDSKGWSPLMVASFHGNSEACKTLVEFGADPNFANLRGTTPLMYAKDYFFESKDISILLFLLSQQADPLRKDVHGKTLLDYLPQSTVTDMVISEIAKWIKL